MHCKSQSASANSLFVIYDLLIYYRTLFIINCMAYVICVYIGHHDVMSVNQNLCKQTFPNHSNAKTRRKCIRILITCLIFPNLYNTTTFIACEVDHGAPKHPSPKKVLLSLSLSCQFTRTNARPVVDR